MKLTVARFRECGELEGSILSRRTSFQRNLLAIGICSLIACQPSSSTDNSQRRRLPHRRGKMDIRAADHPIRDLSQDETAGGHILRKHVGQTDDATARAIWSGNARSPARRLIRTAPPLEHAVGAAIAQSQGSNPGLALRHRVDIRTWCWTTIARSRLGER